MLWLIVGLLGSQPDPWVQEQDSAMRWVGFLDTLYGGGKVSPTLTDRAVATRTAAGEAVNLLKLFTETDPDDEGNLHDEHTQLADLALKSILQVQKDLRLSVAEGDGEVELTTHTIDGAPTSECIICLSAVSDTLLIPCNHLVLCNVRCIVYV